MSKRTITAESLGLRDTDQYVPQIDTSPIDTLAVQKLNAEVISEKKVTLDRAKATEYIDLPIFPGERQVTEGHTQFLYDQMRNGTFNERLVILSTGLLESVTYKINGQHTCWAMLFMPPSFTLQVTEIRYKAKDAAQLKLIYSTYDRQKGRSDGHLGKIMLAGTPIMEGVRASHVDRLLAGLKMWYFEKDSDRRRVTPDQLVTLINKEVGEGFRLVGEFLQQHPDAREVHRQAVIGAMYATFAKVPTKASEFWAPVASGIGLQSKTDARWQLRRLLLELINRAPTSAKRPMPSEELYRICIVAWNRWRRGEAVQVLKGTKERLRPC